MLQFLHIVVQRESLLSDALRQIVQHPAEDLKKQLIVHFVSNGMMEEGVDAGGVTKVSSSATHQYVDDRQVMS